jgi:hypothetical protein
MDTQDTQQLRYLTRRVEQLENRILYLEKMMGTHYYKGENKQ